VTISTNHKQRGSWLIVLAMLVSLSALLSSCITRSELDYYTITARDTTVRETAKNIPGSASDNGVVFPSSRDIQIERQTLSYDSSSERDYPAFLRYGFLEIAGLVTGSGYKGVGPGLLGAYSLLDTLGPIRKYLPTGRANSFFKGMIVRAVPVEYRLRWFNDAPDWTIGTHLFEFFARSENDYLMSVANIYIKKRYWIRDRIPYIILTPFFGYSALPSMYANVGAELQFGSYGGFNLRAYAGYIGGFDVSNPRTVVDFPYVGIGVSALDFTNRVIETERQWKDYTHSAIEVSAIDLTLIHSFTQTNNVFDTSLSIPITGFGLKIATAHFPLPFADNHFWAGTSLFNLFSAGFVQSTFRVLPIQFGYRKYFIAEDLSLEPAVEFNYYPSTYVNISAKLKLDTFLGYTIGVVGGYAGGTTGAFLSTLLTNNGSHATAHFGTIYVGISLGLKDYLLTPERVAFEKAHEPQ
jgi:hypothetical protein